ncbi:MAG TPA: hypothetical protein VG371_16430 [Solirubrobacteraceae bacterium]|jgi:hypothetical protein|nr:hypothetical protein [Solirubrobacteraceae bacterium]
MGLIGKMSEAELQQLVAEACARLGLMHYHTYDSRRSDPGYPDSTIVGCRVLFRELKSRDGVLSPEQRRWGSRIERAGGDWALWRPVDWENATILNQLLALTTERTRVLWTAARYRCSTQPEP